LGEKMTGNEESKLDNKEVLVIGGAGFVGSNLCYKLIETNIKSITVVDNLLSAERDTLPQDKRINFIKGSIVENDVLKRIGKSFEYVFHLATYHGNQSSINDPIADHQNNTFTTLKLCEHFKDVTKLKRFIYASAGCTVAKKTFNKVNATDEDAEVTLYHDSPYQISKIVGEFYGNYYWKRYSLPFVKARFQNVYGPREILGAGQWRGTVDTIWRNVTPSFIWKSIHNESLPLENRGVATRDFIFVDDIVNGLILCAIKGKTGEVYNLASGVETSIRNLADIINSLTLNSKEPELIRARPWDRSGKRFGSTEKAKREIDFSASTSLSDGIRQTIAWTEKNKDLILKNILKHKSYCPEIEKYR
jgi:UDP-glucose 4-epimerase